MQHAISPITTHKVHFGGGGGVDFSVLTFEEIMTEIITP